MRSLLVVALLALIACPGNLPGRQDAGARFDQGTPSPDQRWVLGDGSAPDRWNTASDILGISDTRGTMQHDASSLADGLQQGLVQPPLGGSSKGRGGGTAAMGKERQVAGLTYVLIVPDTYTGAPTRLMLVYSGVEGRSMMTQNLLSVRPMVGLSDAIVAVLDGRNASADQGAAVLDDLRGLYNIDNDRTYLLSESAGTRAGMELGFSLRQSYFAAYWANDITGSGSPKRSAAQLGFAPWGNVGPGGQVAAANTIVHAMRQRGYRLPGDAPYSGPGASAHGDPNQFLAALRFFAQKSRQ